MFILKKNKKSIIWLKQFSIQASFKLESNLGRGSLVSLQAKIQFGRFTKIKQMQVNDRAICPTVRTVKTDSQETGRKIPVGPKNHNALP